MHHSIDRAAALGVRASATIAATASAAWPWSFAAREVRRLVDGGYSLGARYEVAFSLSFAEAAAAEPVHEAARLAGLALDEPADLARGIVTMRLPLRLRPYDLALATARVRAVAARLGAFAELIGPVAEGGPAELSPLADVAFRLAMPPAPNAAVPLPAVSMAGPPPEHARRDAA